MTLTHRADFQAVREQGKSLTTRHLVLARLPRPEQTHFRCAFITSKKSGKAHERNLIRRRLRAILSEVGDQITPQVDLVFIARWCTKDATYIQLRQEFLKLARKLDILKK